MAVPTREQCMGIIRDAGCEEDVILHCQLVEAVALGFAKAINESHHGQVNELLVTAGALLHDLGRAKTHDIEHVVWGVQMAQELDVDPFVVEIIRKHVGGGLTPDDAEQLGLPEWNMMPSTWEEKVVNHADSLVGARGRRTIKKTLKHIRRVGTPSWYKRVREMHRQLSGMAETDLDLVGPWTLPRVSRISRDTGATRFFKDI
ncbi:MAG: HDIG domain-containing protein [Candidatus Thermoplasmatota archaeon]|nr:HDIG domain-containing protein [Candidatus Thermoplasmatota archaeon]